ncbi:MAG: hypothetical protein EFKGCFLK_01586 [Rhodocyclaceae bacterium]|nr:MAG: DUF2237 domain-containing protein [Rhodocyclaceae bacterium]MBE7421953.1 DUF2237 domain-containing protein [Zoogloeaceae bacterium]MBV6408016.1 hypothetical protein [Rhodocyclaceae bacterium]MCK6384291.1 DUF2237 domain-containing protein [Rhodocyclaceae bacterium]CAG0926364.1 hypothetical protein RHDC3_00006 [Rhodocyclaceae bacterium]
MNRDEGGLQRNVLGGPLGVCSEQPVTGFFRTGCCDTGPQDIGRHTVCIVATEEFLAFSKTRGNDLSTPKPEYDFPGVQPGQRWCLCAARWVEAYKAGMAPQVVLNATNEATLDLVPLETLKRYAVDLH